LQIKSIRSQKENNIRFQLRYNQIKSFSFYVREFYYHLLFYENKNVIKSNSEVNYFVAIDFRLANIDFPYYSLQKMVFWINKAINLKITNFSS
jgi:hypothetical protein